MYLLYTVYSVHHRSENKNKELTIPQFESSVIFRKTKIIYFFELFDIYELNQVYIKRVELDMFMTGRFIYETFGIIVLVPYLSTIECFFMV